MFDRVEMHILNVSDDIGFVPERVFPIAMLLYRLFLFCCPCAIRLDA